MRAKRNAYRILVGKPEGKRPLGKHRRGWEDSIKMDLGDIGWGVTDWINLAQDREQWSALVNTAVKLRVPRNGKVFKCLSDWRLLKKGSAP
jgi:hypothetical protein